MRCRLYLNLGLVHENSGDLHSAKKFMEKALSISKYNSVCIAYVYMYLLYLSCSCFIAQLPVENIRTMRVTGVYMCDTFCNIVNVSSTYL